MLHLYQKTFQQLLSSEDVEDMLTDLKDEENIKLKNQYSAVVDEFLIIFDYSSSSDILKLISVSFGLWNSNVTSLLGENITLSFMSGCSMENSSNFDSSFLILSFSYLLRYFFSIRALSYFSLSA
jgi:hypothetical protein